MKSRNNIYLYLSGGWEIRCFNMLFARSLSLKMERNLFIDNFTGFYLDKVYKRKYELKNYNIHYKKVPLIKKLLFWIRWFDKKYKKNNEIFYINNDTIYFKDHFRYNVEYFKDFKNYNIWLVGYWQSPLYFHGYENLIKNELMPKSPLNQKILALGNQIMSENSYSIGVRLYEETLNPDNLSASGKMKQPENINKILKEIKEKDSNAKFYIFSMNKSWFTDELIVKDEAFFVTPENGFQDTNETLWLMTRCKNHIIMNSTFYWWGAFLSSNVHNSTNQKIYYDSNFIYQNISFNNWLKF